MKRALLLVLLFAVALAAQRRGGPGPQHRGGSPGFGARSAPYRSPALYYQPSFYSTPYFGNQFYAPPMPPSAAYGWWSPYPPPVMILAPPVEEKIIYIPTWMRPNNGPSLGEIARQLGGRPHKHPLDKLE